MERVVVTRAMLNPKEAGLYALAFMQVCAVEDATDDEILTVCNRENPAGTTNGWSRVVRTVEDERAAALLPVTCEDDENRKHFLVAC